MMLLVIELTNPCTNEQVDHCFHRWVSCL